MHTFVSILIVVFYLSSAVLQAMHLSAKLDNRYNKVTIRLAPAALASLLHALLLSQQLITDIGIDYGFFNVLSAFAWLIGLMYLLISGFKPIESLGIGLLPIAAVAVAAAELMSDTQVFTAHGPALQFHIITSVLAYSVLSLGTMQALLVGVQIHQLRHHHPGGFMRALPPLQPMEALLFHLLAAGFLLLSVSLVSGFVYLDDMFAQHLVHKTLLSLIAWAVFAILLLGRYFWGWRGGKAVVWCLTGIGLLILAYFGSKLVLEIILQR